VVGIVERWLHLAGQFGRGGVLQRFAPLASSVLLEPLIENGECTMNNIASLTYETLLAYVLPAAIVELLFLPLLNDPLLKGRLGLSWAPASAGYIVLGFIGLSVFVGFLFNIWSTVVTTVTGWQQRNRNRILFGKSDRPSVLFECMKVLYPKTNEQAKVDLVYAIFNSHVPEHVYARRNWDWSFYQASRNILATSPLSITALVLLAVRDAWPGTLIIGVFVAAILVLAAVYFFMLRQLEIYYGFYAHVVLGHLLEQSAQDVSRN
jgi:hypothetical protein